MNDRRTLADEPPASADAPPSSPPPAPRLDHGTIGNGRVLDSARGGTFRFLTNGREIAGRMEYIVNTNVLRTVFVDGEHSWEFIDFAPRVLQGAGEHAPLEQARAHAAQHAAPLHLLARDVLSGDRAREQGGAAAGQARARVGLSLPERRWTDPARRREAPCRCVRRSSHDCEKGPDPPPAGRIRDRAPCRTGDSAARQSGSGRATRCLPSARTGRACSEAGPLARVNAGDVSAFEERVPLRQPHVAEAPLARIVVVDLEEPIE